MICTPALRAIAFDMWVKVAHPLVADVVKDFGIALMGNLSVKDPPAEVAA